MMMGHWSTFAKRELRSFLLFCWINKSPLLQASLSAALLVDKYSSPKNVSKILEILRQNIDI